MKKLSENMNNVIQDKKKIEAKKKEIVSYKALINPPSSNAMSEEVSRMTKENALKLMFFFFDFSLSKVMKSGLCLYVFKYIFNL